MSAEYIVEMPDFVMPRHHVASKSYVHSRNAWIIEIDVPGSGITKRQCERIIEKFRDIAGSGSIISIRRPCGFLAGAMLPWAVDRMDGKGISFDDYLFD